MGEEDADYAIKVMNMIKLYGKPIKVRSLLHPMHWSIATVLSFINISAVFGNLGFFFLCREFRFFCREVRLIVFFRSLNFFMQPLFAFYFISVFLPVLHLVFAISLFFVGRQISISF